MLVEDFYADDEMVITISHMGYIKRTPLTEYKTQNRGGIGIKGSSTRDEDFIEHIYDGYFIRDFSGVPRCSCGGIVKPDVVLYGERSLLLVESL